MSAALPVRYPDTGSPSVMTRRGWWLVLLGILIPGSAQVLAGSRRLGRFGLGATLLLWVLAVLGVLGFVLFRTQALTVLTNSIALWAIVALIAFYGILWIVLGLDTLRLVRLVKTRPSARGAIAMLSVVALAATTGGAAFGVVNIVSGIGLLDQVFSGGNVAEPIDGRYNILLLGGDAGADRQGLRPDSISVVSIEAATGAVSIFGIPRNLQRAPFSEGSPLYQDFPNGYDCGDECLVSYLWTYGHEHPDLYPEALDAGSDPGIEAMRDAAEGITGLAIQYYVLIDMQGFTDLIDALGGVEIDVKQDLPIGPNTDQYGNPKEPDGYLRAGKRTLNGAEALWYARSRYGTTDYDRMKRQREVQEAILSQADPANVIARFQAVAQASGEVVSTDIPQGMLGHFADLAEKSREHDITDVEFVPPEWDPVYPDYAAIHAEVARANRPATPSPAP
ncbi:LCP family protein [Homoserinibacter sp. YIM 151385]|uniref:LCP family protein n=1 Tax=Homoserinibacter sp. YIM 151385 TaxID=2985506 RepID=UPI0022F0C9D9|nr:LCP family protein [Homoserinibacter sp. YIM 151385]WBU36792.1 LCP family protein [Homoserinibacter sp. YIM 151385]